MARNKWSILFYLIIGFGIIGLLSQIFTQPGSFFASIFTTIGIGIAIFAVIYFVFLRNRAPSNDMKKYKKAVRQSKAKYNKNTQTHNATPKHNQKKQSNLIKKKRNKRTAGHLKVIEGNKTKRKDRASF
ncbi:SA1362 family protein [Oceanobacillus senegalensis]|uniref:SA1362 family protein n=1 Tax=Oceanobacillus senegalensis TaxID=1936063 RepID=UPI000A30AE9B|nr:SA1362 family protein [Oceanobacillus senegalensis]